MGDEGGDEMSRRRSSASATAGPLDDQDLLAEIFLWLPSNPSSLPRASLVCKRWRSIAAADAFRNRFRAHHRKPPILGVFRRDDGELVFTSVLDPPDRIPRERFTLRVGTARDAWTVLGCRHGRVLAINHSRLEVLVFHPVSGDRRIVSIPPDFVGRRVDNGAVLCAAGDDQDHVHGDCHSSPFKVVLVRSTSQDDIAIARVYSSETGMWGDLSMTKPCTGFFISYLPSTLVGNSLYWWWRWTSVSAVGSILRLDLDNQSLTVINGPPIVDIYGNRRIIRTKDGSVGVAVLLYPSFQMWGRKVSSHGVSSWVLEKTVNMQNILGLPSSVESDMVAISGYAEEADSVFISVHRYPFRGVFIVQLESMQLTKGPAWLLETAYYPFVDFYTAGVVATIVPAKKRALGSESSACSVPHHQNS